MTTNIDALRKTIKKTIYDNDRHLVTAEALQQILLSILDLVEQIGNSGSTPGGPVQAMTDAELSTTSENPVQNKVITNALENCMPMTREFSDDFDNNFTR